MATEAAAGEEMMEETEMIDSLRSVFSCVAESDSVPLVVLASVALIGGTFMVVRTAVQLAALLVCLVIAAVASCSER